MIFPDALRCAEESVNEFVLNAMQTTTHGDYDSYRLLWSAFEKPLTRREYEEGWSAVKTVELRALQKVKVSGWPDVERGGEELTTVYLLAAAVSIDPQHRMARRQPPHRDVALMLVSEQGQWRLAEPPPRLRKWLRDFLTAKAGPSGEAVTPAAPDSDASS